MPSVSSVLAVLLLAGSTVLAGPIVGRSNDIQCTYDTGLGIIEFNQAQAAGWLAGTMPSPLPIANGNFKQALQDCCAKGSSSRVAPAEAPPTENADEKAAVYAKPKQAANRIGGAPTDEKTAVDAKPKQAANRLGDRPSEKADAKAATPDPQAPSVSDKSSGDARVSDPTDPLSGLNIGNPAAVVGPDPTKEQGDVAGLTTPVDDPTNEGNERAGINVAGLSNPTAQGSAKPAGTNEGKEKAHAKVPAAGGPQKHAGATKLPTEDEKADADAKKSSTDEAVSDKSSDQASTGANSLNGLNLDKPTSDAVDAAVADSSDPLDDPTNEQGSADAGTNQHGGDEKAAAKVSEPATPKPAAPEPANDRIGTGSHKSSKESVQKPVPATEKADISEQQPSEPASAPTEQTSEQAAAGSPPPLGLGGNGVKEGVMDNGKCTCPV